MSIHIPVQVSICGKYIYAFIHIKICMKSLKNLSSFPRSKWILWKFVNLGQTMFGSILGISKSMIAQQVQQGAQFNWS